MVADVFAAGVRSFTAGVLLGLFSPWSLGVNLGVVIAVGACPALAKLWAES